MAFSVTRLTIYAFLSSMEEDLRAILVGAVDGGSEAAHVLGDSLFADAARRMADELGALRREPTLGELLPYTDLGDIVDVLNRHRAALSPHVAEQLKRLNPQLKLLLPVRKRIAHVRPFRYDDLARVTTFADQVTAEDPLTWQSVTETLARLAQDPSFVFSLPEPRYEAPPNAPFHNLPLPDYDDTGFLGRDTELAQVMALCRGPWPVISLVGEGGLGKTALAVQVANEFLEEQDRPFDAIIWSSSKTNQLTATQIRDISGAIRDSVGLFDDVATEIGAVGSADAESELIDFLSTFRTLLVLDNLETVLDTRVRQFINRLPSGSKLLITSRIGIGEFENRIKLQPLPNAVATRLLRAVAKLGGVQNLGRLPEQQLADMCERMQNNPLFIKWFVSAVQSGARPEEVLSHPDLFLDFCMSNVYGHLSGPARQVVKVLVAIPDELTLAEVTYYNGGDAFETQAALQELLTTNMMTMNSAPQGSVVESRYLLTELARLYLNKHHPLSADEDHDFEALREQLESDKALFGKRLQGHPYDYMTVSTRSTSDFIVAKFLLQALKHAEGKRFDEALEQVQSAKQLASDYYEVYRVEAQVLAASGNIRSADDAFGAAMDIQPDATPLRLFYAVFLREIRKDVDGALVHVEHALRQAPDDPYVLLEHARCNLELLAFEAAHKSITRAMTHAKRRSDELDAWELNFEYHQRVASFAIETRDYARAVAAAETVKTDVERAPATNRSQLRRRLSELCGALWCVLNESEDHSLTARARASLHWLQGVPGLRVPLTVPLSVDRTIGKLRWRSPDKPFGFITTDEGLDVFLSRSNMRLVADFDLLRPGTRISFVTGANEKGRKALDAYIA